MSGRKRPELPIGTRLILASENLLDQFGTRTERGEKITAEWGERTPQGWYEPVFTVHYDDTLAGNPIRAALERIKGPILTAAHVLGSTPEEPVWVVKREDFDRWREELLRMSDVPATAAASEENP